MQWTLSIVKTSLLSLALQNNQVGIKEITKIYHFRRTLMTLWMRALLENTCSWKVSRITLRFSLEIVKTWRYLRVCISKEVAVERWGRATHIKSRTWKPWFKRIKNVVFSLVMLTRNLQKFCKINQEETASLILSQETLSLKRIKIEISKESSLAINRGTIKDILCLTSHWI